MASHNTELLSHRPNTHSPLTLADLVAICATCTTQVELWWMLEPHVTAHMWDENEILVIWHNVRSSMAQEGSSSSQRRRLRQGTEEQSATAQRQRKQKIGGRSWIKKGWVMVWRVLRKLRKRDAEE